MNKIDLLLELKSKIIGRVVNGHFMGVITEDQLNEMIKEEQNKGSEDVSDSD